MNLKCLSIVKEKKNIESVTVAVQMANDFQSVFILFLFQLYFVFCHKFIYWLRVCKLISYWSQYSILGVLIFVKVFRHFLFMDIAFLLHFSSLNVSVQNDSLVSLTRGLSLPFWEGALVQNPVA